MDSSFFYVEQDAKCRGVFSFSLLASTHFGVSLVGRVAVKKMIVSPNPNTKAVRFMPAAHFI